MGGFLSEKRWPCNRRKRFGESILAGLGMASDGKKRAGTGRESLQLIVLNSGFTGGKIRTLAEGDVGQSLGWPRI